MALDVVSLVNLIVSALISGLALWGYLTSRNKLLVYLSMGFGLFALSHLVLLAGLGDALALPIIIVRLLGYLVVLFALVVGMKK